MWAPVFDDAGLGGQWDVALTTPRDSIALYATTGLPGPEGSASLQTTVREQLGLKLESTKHPLNVLVIDAVRTPTAN